ncbi:hypothetical protein KR009_000803 [Drosophila setifemur]|nr:hypothetical protein KR009_000803 [Drosophila setifemur]
MSGEDALVEIPRNDWTKLRDLYVHKDTDPQGYPCINNFINWVEQEPNLEVKFFSLNGDWEEDGTFVLIVDLKIKWKHLFFNTLSDDLDRVTRAVECLKSFENQYSFFGFSSRVRPVVDYISQKYYTKKLEIVDTFWYHASKELIDTFVIDPPPGIKLSNLTFDDAETINEIWPHRHTNSVNFVKTLIKFNVNVGAYDESGKLVAWCLRLPIGSLGLLQVLDSHKRLGLGNLMVRSLAKKISALGDQVVAPVVLKNVASKSMFEKIGFKPIDTAHWAD